MVTIAVHHYSVYMQLHKTTLTMTIDCDVQWRLECIISFSRIESARLPDPVPPCPAERSRSTV